MWKLLRWLFVAGFVILALPSIAFTGLIVWGFHPTVAFGRGIGDLTYDDQVAYLILIDQVGQHRSSGKLPITIQRQACTSPSPALENALARSWAFNNVSLKPAVCSSPYGPSGLYVELREGAYRGGYACGALCGEGNFYQDIQPFGLVMVLRTKGYVN